jgi:hypothetical protein
MIANRTLGYVAAMQEHGVPVTYSYISDAHAAHTGSSTDGPFGPGEAGYVAQLKAYDQAFASFFANLAAHGITRANTVFTFTSDEGDHLIAGPPSPANCDGIHIPCTYAKIGEVAGNIKGLIATQTIATTRFSTHNDSAPNFYITGNPSSTDPITRTLERAAGTVTAVNPYSGATEVVDNFLADRAEMNLLHMLTADRARDASFTMFAKPDYFLFSGAPNCNIACVSIGPAFNWNHGDIAPEINTTWLGLVGPDVKNLGETGDLWTDHSDIRPTLMALTGLQDDYIHQGRPISQVMTETRQDLNQLADVYKQINAPVGQLSLDSIAFATRATLSNSAGDQTYIDADAQIAAWATQRNALAAQMIALLDTTAPGASTQHNDRSVNDLITQGQQLLAEVHAAAA